MTVSVSSSHDLQAALAVPERTPAPGLIVLMEWWGLNDDIRALCQRFASEGFLALAPDLYHGEVTTEASRAYELSDALRTMDAVSDVALARDFLVADPRCSGRVAVTGFCLGGAVTLAAACNLSDLAAAVPFYGIPKAEHADYARVTAPIQAHFGAADPLIAKERAESVREQLLAAGKSVELHLYDAGHAFMRAGDPQAYHEPSATLAWRRSLDFLRRHTAMASAD